MHRPRPHRQSLIGSKVKLTENGSNLTVIGVRRMFGSPMQALKVRDSEGRISEYPQDQFYKSEEEDIEKAVPIGTVNAHGKIKTANGWVHQKKGGKSGGEEKKEGKKEGKKPSGSNTGLPDVDKVLDNHGKSSEYSSTALLSLRPLQEKLSKQADRLASGKSSPASRQKLTQVGNALGKVKEAIAHHEKNNKKGDAKESELSPAAKKKKLKEAHKKMDAARDKITAAERGIEYHGESKEKKAHSSQLKEEKIKLKEAKKELTAAIKEASKYVIRKSFQEAFDILKGEETDIEKAQPIGTVNAHGKIKTAEGWVHQKKSRGGTKASGSESSKTSFKVGQQVTSSVKDSMGRVVSGEISAINEYGGVKEAVIRRPNGRSKSVPLSDLKAPGGEKTKEGPKKEASGGKLEKIKSSENWEYVVEGLDKLKEDKWEGNLHQQFIRREQHVRSLKSDVDYLKRDIKEAGLDEFKSMADLREHPAWRDFKRSLM